MEYVENILNGLGINELGVSIIVLLLMYIAKTNSKHTKESKERDERRFKQVEENAKRVESTDNEVIAIAAKFEENAIHDKEWRNQFSKMFIESQKIQSDAQKEIGRLGDIVLMLKKNDEQNRQEQKKDREVMSQFVTVLSGLSNEIVANSGKIEVNSLRLDGHDKRLDNHDNDIDKLKAS